MSVIKQQLAGTTQFTTSQNPPNSHNSQQTAPKSEVFCIIDINVVTPDSQQPRKYFNKAALGELAQSIKKNGVLQPIMIRKDSADRVWLVAGERRLKAAKLAGLTQIPAIITSGNPAEIALIENLQREDLKPIEEAEGYARIMDQHGYKQNELAKIVGKGRSTVAEILTLTKLPLSIRKECQTSEIPKNVLLEIAKQPNEEKMSVLFKRAKKSNFTVAAIRQITRNQPDNSQKSSPGSVIIRKITTLTASLSKVSPNNFEQDEHKEINQELEKLKEIMGIWLQV